MKLLAINLIINYIDCNYKNCLNRELIEDITGYSFDYIDRCFSKETGKSIISYSKELQMMYIFDHVFVYKESFNDIDGNLYWNDMSSFYKAFKNTFDKTPTEYLVDYDDECDYSDRFLYEIDMDDVVYLNILEYFRYVNGISVDNIAKNCNLSPYIVNYYLNKNEAYIPNNILRSISKTIGISPGKAMIKVSEKRANKVYESLRLFDEKNKKLLLKTLKSYDITCGIVSDFAFGWDIHHHYPQVFLGLLKYKQKSYDIRFSLTVCKDQFVHNMPEYHLILKQALSSGYSDLLDEKLSELLKVLIEALLDYAFLTSLSTVRVIGLMDQIEDAEKYQVFKGNSVNSCLYSRTKINALDSELMNRNHLKFNMLMSE